jgi:hypothetical protein
MIGTALAVIPDPARLLTVQDVERITGLANLRVVPRDLKAGAVGDVNVARSNGELVTTLLVQKPDLYDRWQRYHRKAVVKIDGLGEQAFGRLYGATASDSKAAEAKPAETKPGQKPAPDPKDKPSDPDRGSADSALPSPVLAACYVKQGPVAFTVTNQPFGDTRSPSMTSEQLDQLARLVAERLVQLELEAKALEDTAISKPPAGNPDSKAL